MVSGIGGVGIRTYNTLTQTERDKLGFRKRPLMHFDASFFDVRRWLSKSPDLLPFLFLKAFNQDNDGAIRRR